MRKDRARTINAPLQVAIIGGGVSGCATAYYLGARGIPWTLFERTGIAAEASGWAAGILEASSGYERKGNLVELYSRAFELHRDLWTPLIRATGVDFHPREVETIHIAFNNAELLHHEVMIKGFNCVSRFSAEPISLARIHQLSPGVSKEVVGGFVAQGTISIDCQSFAKALLRGALREQGGLISAPAISFATDHGRVVAVCFDDGAIAADAVVLAGGPWTADLAAMLSIPLPVSPLKGEILRLRSPTPGRKYSLASRECTIWVKEEGQVWVASTEERCGFDKAPSAAAQRHLRAAAGRILPASRQWEILRQTACLRPVTPDGMPVIGRAPGWENVYIATGGAKKGILLGPAMGKAMADLIVDGATDLPLSQADPARFEEE